MTNILYSLATQSVDCPVEDIESPEINSEPSHIASGNVKCCSQQFVNFLKSLNKIITWCSNYTSVGPEYMFTQRLECDCF